MDVDPLEWWKHEANCLPVLSVLAKIYLCICGTSIPSERLSRYITNAFLLPEKVNALT